MKNNEVSLPVVGEGIESSPSASAESRRSIAPTPQGPKKRVYFNEYNVLMDNIAYLPLVSGLLQAYAQQSEQVNAGYEFMPFLFCRGPAEPLAKQHDKPDVAGFSISMWNEQLSLKVAQAVKRRFPHCVIIVGGPQAPHHAEPYFEQHPFVDVTVRGPGEQPFQAVLERLMTSKDLSGISGVTWRDPSGRSHRNEEETALPNDLDCLPSPYLEGLYNNLFDDIGDAKGDLQFQAIIETNRGCPFPCAFCYWGQGGLSRKYRFHSIERVTAEIEWFARHRIRYVFNADSNFGMHKQDQFVVEALAAAKQKHGFPEKFRTCFGKNTDDRIFEIASYLHNKGLGKGITLARQSNDDQVLKNIKRQNIKISTYKNLQTRLNESDVPVYSELILGLPGEDYDTWTSGIEQMLQSGLKNQLFIYQCQVLPNTDLGDPDYQERFGIKVKRIALAEIHGGIRPQDLLTEYEEIIIATDSMPVEQWRRMSMFSWFLMSMHGLKLGFFLMIYLAERYGMKYTDFVGYVSQGRFNADAAPIIAAEREHFERHLSDMLDGQARAVVMGEYSNLYWDIEEASLLRVSEDIDAYYHQLKQVVLEFFEAEKIEIDVEELSEAMIYQRMRMPSLGRTTLTQYTFNTNFPEYFDLRLGANPIALRQAAQTMNIEVKDYDGDKPRYARETILWGRKSGSMLTRYQWQGASATHEAA